jgi:hypothetical protein
MHTLVIVVVVCGPTVRPFVLILVCNRRNFVDLFTAVATCNGQRAGELMISRCAVVWRVRQWRVVVVLAVVRDNSGLVVLAVNES